jgi:DNA-binding transcriptional ArsR family regulator
MKNNTAVTAFTALGQESRLNVFRLIVQRANVGVTPSEIIELLGIPGATLSFHLKELTNAGLISYERQSRSLIYKPEPKFINELVEFLSENCCDGQPCGMPLKGSVSLAGKRKGLKAQKA